MSCKYNMLEAAEVMLYEAWNITLLYVWNMTGVQQVVDIRSYGTCPDQLKV